MTKLVALFALSLLGCSPDSSPIIATDAQAQAAGKAVVAQGLEAQVRETTYAIQEGAYAIADWYRSTLPRSEQAIGRSQGEGAAFTRDGQFVDVSFVQPLGDGAFRVVMPDLPTLQPGKRLQYRYKRMSRGVFEGLVWVDVDLQDGDWHKLVPIFGGNSSTYWWYRDFEPNTTADSLTYDRVSFKVRLLSAPTADE